MKRSLQIVILLISLSFYGQSKDKKIEYLVNELGYFESIKEILFSYNLEHFKNSGGKNGDRIKILERKLTDEEILKRLSSTYAKTFTEKEIDDLYNFYSSETGKKYAKSQYDLENNIKNSFDDIFQEIEMIKKEDRKEQINQSSALNKFLNTILEKENGFYLVSENKINKEESTFQVEKNPSLTLNDIKDVKANYNNFAGVTINITFKESAAKKLQEVTANNINKGMAIIIDHKVIAMPTITSEIPDGKVQISRDFSVAKANDLVIKLKNN